MSYARQFFALPEPDKRLIDMENSPHFRGYARIAWERTRGLHDWREQIDIGAERAALARSPDLPAWARLQGPNQWPAVLPVLRPAVLDWQAAAKRHASGPERDSNNPLFRSVGENYLKGRLRSHPDVARRYYADLIEPDASAVQRSGY